MNELAKLAMTKDLFIYSVNQAYEARMQSDGSFNSHLKYEPFLEKTWSLPKNPDINSLKKTLAEIIEHHFSKLPNYRREEAVNLENISWFSHSIAALFADIEYLLMAYTGAGLPMLAEAKVPKTNSSKNIIVAIKKYSDFISKQAKEEKFSLFPISGEDGSALDNLYTQEIWSLIFYYIKKFFGNYVELLCLYVTWKYVIKANSKEVVDWNVRPPCGDAYRNQFKHLFEKDNFKNNNKKNSDDNRCGFNKPKPRNHIEEIVTDMTNNTSASLLESSNYKFSPKKHTQFKERKETRHSQDRESRQNQEEIIEKALHEVAQAMEKMHKNANIQEIELSPQNSFIRRQQHVMISENEFETESRGDAENRCVCIKRKLS